MSTAEVVNIHHGASFDVYIGRKPWKPFHYGNPFTHIPNVKGTVQVSSRREAINKFRWWLKGESEFAHIEPERRQWILDNLDRLRGQRLGCFCRPKECHGDVYIELLACLL